MILRMLSFDWQGGFQPRSNLESLFSLNRGRKTRAIENSGWKDYFASLLIRAE